MATRNPRNVVVQSEGEPVSLTLSEANARAWIVSALLCELRDTDFHHGIRLCAEKRAALSAWADRLLMVESAMDGCQTQLDELDESDAALVQLVVRKVAMAFDSASKVLMGIDDESSRIDVPLSRSQLAMLQASYTLCRDISRTLDRALALGIWQIQMPHEA